MSWVNPLIQDYYNWLKSKTVILPDEKTEWVAIQTPFIGLFNDVIEMYAQKKGERIIYEINNNLNGIFYTLMASDSKTEYSLDMGNIVSDEYFTSWSKQMFTSYFKFLLLYSKAINLFIKSPISLGDLISLAFFLSEIYPFK